MLAAGQTIGSVILQHKIAEGGMASVWAGEHITLKREVAVKFLTREGSSDPQAVERFALEARTIARIASPHIPQVFDHAIDADGVPYMVMELVVGRDLKSWLSSRGTLDVNEMTRLVEQMCIALTAAHELGVVHRDVKPENILVCGEGPRFHTKLLDFGVAKSIGLALSSPSLTLPGTMVGTPSYMSPEQLADASTVDERADVWSLGVVAYWALTGLLPFRGGSFEEVCLAITQGRLTPPSAVRPGVPPELDAWFEKALARDPAARFASAELMSRMLRVAVASAGAARNERTEVTRNPLPVVPRLAPRDASGDDDGPTAASRLPGRAAYAASAVALGVLVMLGFAFDSSRAAKAASDVHAAETERRTPAPAPPSPSPPPVVADAVTLPPAAAPLAAATTEAPIAMAPPAKKTQAPSARRARHPTASASSVANAAATPPVSSAPGEPASPSVGGAPDAGPAPVVAAGAGGATVQSLGAHDAGADPADWQPTEELGEPTSIRRPPPTR